MSSTLKYLMAMASLSVLALMVQVQPCVADALQHWQVQVINNMQSKQTLFLHCKSKDDDLGQQNLGFGQQFSWRFRMNFWQTTLFWCYMRNQHNHMALPVFWPDGKYPWLSSRCNDEICIWSVRDDGIYLKNIPQNVFELHANWIPGWKNSGM